MADRRQRLAGCAEGANEGNRFGLQAQLVRIDDAAGQHQRVEIIDAGIVQIHVDLHRAAPVAAAPALDVRRVAGGNHDDLCAGVFQQLFGAGQLDVLKSVSGKHGDAAAAQWGSGHTLLLRKMESAPWQGAHRAGVVAA